MLIISTVFRMGGGVTEGEGVSGSEWRWAYPNPGQRHPRGRAAERDPEHGVLILPRGACQGGAGVREGCMAAGPRGREAVMGNMDSSIVIDDWELMQRGCRPYRGPARGG